MVAFRAIALDLRNTEDCLRWDEAIDLLDPRTGHYHKTALLRPLVSVSKLTNLSQMIEHQGRIVAVFPLFLVKSRLFGTYLTSTPAYNYGGMRVSTGQTNLDAQITDWFTDYALTEAQKAKATHVQFRNSVDHRSFGCPLGDCWSESTEKVNMLLTLPEDMQSIGAGNAKKRQKLRSQAQLAVRKTQEEGKTLEQHFGHVELLDDFYSVFSKHMRTLGTPVYSYDWFEAILREPGNNATLTVAYIDGQPMACGFLLDHQNGLFSIPWASALSASNPYSLNTHMYWNILEWAIQSGGHTFDFGRSSVDSGTFAFKKQWGAEPLPCYWLSWSANPNQSTQLSPSNPKFSLAIEIWKRLPLWITNWVGPRIAAQLP